MLLSELVHRDIGILGAGREGQAVWRWLRTRYPEKPISIYDEQPASKAQKAIFNGPYDHLVTGMFDVDHLARHDLLIRSPGISPYRSELVALRNKGVQFSSASSLWFAQHPEAKTICITGTKGKSTTASLVAHLISASGLKVQLAGNIGQPLLEFDKLEADWWVIELSSYQLVDLEARPSIAAILNLTDEHLDWHGGRQAYQDDKLRIAELAEDAPLIANRSDDLLVQRLSGRDGLVWFGEEAGFHVTDNRLWHGETCLHNIPRRALQGPHNLCNLAAALSILEQAGIELKNVAASLSSFTSLPHRLQDLGQLKGVNYVSDSLSTTPVATLAALEALRGSRIILLLGGLDRGLDWQPLMPQMKELCPFAVICLPDNGPEIASVIEEAGLRPKGGIQCAASLDSAMAMVAVLAKEGDTVLLSPGAPSFPHFSDYQDRGDQFKRLAGL